MTVLSMAGSTATQCPPAVMQRGRCGKGECGQFSISISNGEVALTIRFEGEQEFCAFLIRGDLQIER
jgi:hypothetical protein